jgi:hypothetical protein
MGDMPLPRISIRGGMVLVLAVGLGLGLGPPAVQVCRCIDSHAHAFIRPSLLCFDAERIPTPFWPRYWARLLGRSGRGAWTCSATKRRPGEICEIEHPGNVYTNRLGSDFLVVEPTAEMDRLMRKMERLAGKNGARR